MNIADSNNIEFELIEIIAELEIPVRKIKTLKPLKSGDSVYGLTLEKENINKQRFLKNALVNSSVLLRQIADKPLVLFFYSSAWQQNGSHYLQQLNSINPEIKAVGANLLVVSADDDGRLLEQTIWDNSLSLNFYFDNDNLIARKFGIYSDEAPTWDKYPGLEVNVPLLATYVLDAGHQINFGYVDKDLEGNFYPADLLRALASNASHKRKSA